MFLCARTGKAWENAGMNIRGAFYLIDRIMVRGSHGTELHAVKEIHISRRIYIPLADRIIKLHECHGFNDVPCNSSVFCKRP